jgi:tetratricopeptide (TPR) repeat protein
VKIRAEKQIRCRLFAISFSTAKFKMTFLRNIVMVKFFLLLALLPSSFVAQGQTSDPPASTFTLVGSIRNPEGRGVSGVRLTVLDDSYQIVRSIYVDASGRFTVRGLTMGRYTVRVETSGTPFDEYSQQLELQALRRFGGDETMTMEITLKYKKGAELPTRSGSVFAQEVPKAARAEFNRGANHAKSNRGEAAIASLKKAIDLFPGYFDALELLGIEYVKNGQYELAIQTLTQAFKINDRSPKTLYAIGVAYLNLHNSPAAIEWLVKADQLDPNNANTHMMLGLAYGKSDLLDKAEASFRKALQLGGTAAVEAHFYLAGLFNKQGKYREAGRELELFLKDSKNVKDPAQIKAMIEKLKEKERMDPAQSAAARAPSSQSSSPSILSGTQAEILPGSHPETIKPSTETDETKSSPGVTGSTVTSTGDNGLLSNPIQPLPPETVEMLQQCEVNGGKTHKQLFDYTYTLKKTRRVLNERGATANTEEQIFEAYPIRGEHVLIRLSTNGTPSQTLADDRKRAVKQLEEAERQSEGSSTDQNELTGKLGYVSAGVLGATAGQPGYVSIDVSAFLRACEFYSPRAEKIAGRDMLVLNFRRRTGINLPPNQAYISKLVGTIWIDQSDQIVTRLEAWPAAHAAFDLLQSTAHRDDASLIYQQQRLDNGLWFPILIRMNAGGRAELFSGLNWDVVFEFSNYQRFDASAGKVIINPVNKNP